MTKRLPLKPFPETSVPVFLAKSATWRMAVVQKECRGSFRLQNQSSTFLKQ